MHSKQQRCNVICMWRGKKAWNLANVGDVWGMESWLCSTITGLSWSPLTVTVMVSMHSSLMR